MPDLPSRLDLYGIGRDYVLQRAKRIDPKQVDILGSDVNIFIGSTSQIAFALVLQLAYRINSLFLDSATGEDLDRWARDRYELFRKGASAAVGTLRVYRSNALVGAGSVAAGTQIKSLTGDEYVTTSAAVFAPGALVATCYVRAVQAGKNSQVGANALRKFANASQLFDSSLQCNNDAPTAGGEDAEDDDTFRARIRGYWSTARRGTLGAIEFGAKQIAGVYSAKAVEALTPGAYPARVVLLYAADSSGVSSAALATSIRNGLDEYRAAGIAVLPGTSQPQIISLKLNLSFLANENASFLVDAIRAAVLEFVNSLGVNEPLLKGELYAVLARFKPDGLVLNQSTILDPLGDIYPLPGKSLRTTAGNISIND